jgi:hypothetical protein
MDTFAKKLVEGLIQVPSRISWWPRHSREMIRFLHLERDTKSSHEKIRNIVGKNATEWESGICITARKGLMRHHGLLEVELVEAARSKKASKIDKIGSLLAENTEEMAASFGKSVVDFPEMQFVRLLAEHVGSFVEMVRWNVEGAMKKPVDRMERNTVSLAAFTAEWF